MRFAVVVFPGSNCDEDAAAAIHKTTSAAVDLVWHTTENLDAYDAIVLPGGFSYGDYLRSGAIAHFSSAMVGVKKAAHEGRLVLGICNGFQVLTESGLLPGGLARNHHLQFRCEMVQLVVANNTSPFTIDYVMNEQISIPIAHGEGRFHAEDAEIAALIEGQRVAFRYANDVNGSKSSIAGVLNMEGNVLGLMPHPERAVETWMNSVDGRRMFTSMQRSIEEGIHAH